MPTTKDRFVTHTAAASILGVSRLTLSRRVARGDLRVFNDPGDRRVKLIARDELAQYATPQPLGGDRPKATAATPLTAA